MNFSIFFITFFMSICVSEFIWAMPVRFGSTVESKVSSTGETSHAQQSFFEVYEFKNPISQMPDFSQPGRSFHPSATESVTGKSESATQNQSSMPSVPSGAELISSVPLSFTPGPPMSQAPSHPQTQPAPIPQALPPLNLSHLAPLPKVEVDPLANFSIPSAPIPSFQFPTTAPLFSNFEIGVSQDALSQAASTLSASLNFDLNRALNERFAAMAEEDAKIQAFRKEVQEKKEEGLRQIEDHYQTQREKIAQSSRDWVKNLTAPEPKLDIDALVTQTKFTEEEKKPRVTNETPIQEWAETVQAEVERKGNQALELLDHPRVVEELSYDPDIRTSIREEIEQSKELAQEALELSTQPRSEPLVRYMGNVASKVIDSTHRFLVGVRLGSYRGFKSAAQVISSIYQDPALVGTIADGLIDVAKTLRDLQFGDPEAWGKVKDAVWDFSVKFYLASAQERGEIVGEFAADFMIAATTEGVGSKIIGIAKGVANRAVKTGITKEVGKQLLTKIEADAALRTGLGPTQAEAQIAAQRIADSAGEVIKSAPKHIPGQVKDIEAWQHIGEYLGNKKVTDINPFTGQRDANRIFSQQESGVWRSLRFGKHEMAKPAGKGMHYHLEEWTEAGKVIKPDASVNVLRTKGK